jgi:hypothetical protein
MFYWPHHYVVLPAAVALAFYAGRRYNTTPSGADTADLWLVLAALAVTVTAVLLLVRQHYALGLQDRLIRLEVRQRYFELTGRSLRPLEERLKMGQLTAVRFASDAQLPALIEAAAAEQLTSTAIIERIGDSYQPDLLRL